MAIVVELNDFFTFASAVLSLEVDLFKASIGYVGTFKTTRKYAFSFDPDYRFRIELFVDLSNLEIFNLVEHL